MVLLAAYLRGQAQNNFEWKDASGNTHNLAELQETLRKHKQWVESEEKSGTRADLNHAHLGSADLTRAQLSRAHLTGAELFYADLKDAYLMEADLTSADLTDADLKGAHLNGTYLNGAHLNGAHLNNAHLSSADLKDAYLMDADLSGVDLASADLNGADFDAADLGRALFEPKSLPELRGIAAAKNLELLTYNENPDALVRLRKQFEDAGFREQERKITYALKRREADLSCEKCTSRKLSGGHEASAIVWSSDSVFANCGSFILNKVFFDWTCQYGMSPGRPLTLVLLLWFVCSLVYFGCIHTRGEAGLYRIYGQNIREDPSAQRRAERISRRDRGQSRGARWILQSFWCECLLLRTSMFFSLMSAFNIGFRDINFGRWKIAHATGVRHQGGRLGQSGSGVAVADQRLSDRALGSNLFWPTVWLRRPVVAKCLL